MTIQHIADSCFSIQTKNDADEVGILLNPPMNSKLPKTTASILLSPTAPFDLDKAPYVRIDAERPPLVIDTPGEYEKSGVVLYGIPEEKNGRTFFVLGIEDVSICYIPHGFTQKKLTSDQLERIGKTDVVLFPLDGSVSEDIIDQLEPRIIVSAADALGKGMEEKIKKIGAEIRHEQKYKIQNKTLPQETTEVVLLEV